MSDLPNNQQIGRVNLSEVSAQPPISNQILITQPAINSSQSGYQPQIQQPLPPQNPVAYTPLINQSAHNYIPQNLSNNQQNYNPLPQNPPLPPPPPAGYYQGQVIQNGVPINNFQNNQMAHPIEEQKFYFYQNAPMPRDPIFTRCPICQKEIFTQVVKQNGDFAVLAGFLFCLLLGLCCFWIPYCLSYFKDSKHYCPECNNQIGRFKAG